MGYPCIETKCKCFPEKLKETASVQPTIISKGQQPVGVLKEVALSQNAEFDPLHQKHGQPPKMNSSDECHYGTESIKKPPLSDVTREFLIYFEVKMLCITVCVAK